MFNTRTVLVTGSTGGQGGAVARSLLDAGWEVRALVRDPGSEGAEALDALGAKVVVGDLGDDESLRAAMDGCHAVFSVQPADLTNPDPDLEVHQGKSVADAASAVGVGHFVYSSVGAVGRGSGVRHFDSKEVIEEHVRSLGLPTTILRPVFFMENWLYMLPEASGGERVGAIALSEGASLQMIALQDVGRIAAEVFGNPDEFIGTTLEIAGDELTVQEIAEAFTAVDGVPTRFVRQPDKDLRGFSAELANMFDWLETKGYQADIGALRARHPELLTLRAWLAAAR